MAVLNRDTSIGDITDVYDRLKNGSGAGIKNFIDISTGDIIDLFVISNTAEEGVDLEVTEMYSDTFNSLQKSPQANTCVLYFKEGTYHGNYANYNLNQYKNLIVMGEGDKTILSGAGAGAMNSFNALKSVTYKNLKFNAFCPSIASTRKYIFDNVSNFIGGAGFSDCAGITFKNMTFNNGMRLSEDSSAFYSYLGRIYFDNCKFSGYISTMLGSIATFGIDGITTTNCTFNLDAYKGGDIGGLFGGMGKSIFEHNTIIGTRDYPPTFCSLSNFQTEATQYIIKDNYFQIRSNGQMSSVGIISFDGNKSVHNANEYNYAKSFIINNYIEDITNSVSQTGYEGFVTGLTKGSHNRIILENNILAGPIQLYGTYK